MSLRVITILTMLVAASVQFTPTASAQGLDDQWFKVTINMRGSAITPLEEVEKTKGKVTCYVIFNANMDDDGGAADGFSSTSYGYSVWSEIAPGNWQVSSVGLLLTAGENESLMVGSDISPSSNGIKWQVVVPDKDATTLQISFIARLKLVYDKNADLKKASFKSMGSMMPFGTGGGDVLYGDAKLKGKLVAIDKLPFEP